MDRKQFTFYRSYYEALKTLPAEDFKAAILAVCAYALDEEEPNLSGVPHAIFTLIRPTLDSGRIKARNRINKKEQAKNKPTSNEEQTDIKQGTNEEQTENKPRTNEEQNGKEKEREVEREVESENDLLKILSPGGDNTERPAAAPFVPAFSRSVSAADYLNRVNAAASPMALEELTGYEAVMGPDVCRRAIDIALDERKPQWSYIRAILRDKQAQGVRCLADWDALDKQRSTGVGKRRDQAPPRKSWTEICGEMEAGKT